MVRLARPDDVSAIVALAEEKRFQYAQYQPVFWRVAEDAVFQHRPFVANQVDRQDVITLVHEDSLGTISGFIIAIQVAPPAVYDPGGPSCYVDDFWVQGGRDWETVGIELLDAAIDRARREWGATQVVVVSGHLDHNKREFLTQQGLSIATEWYVRPLDSSSFNPSVTSVAEHVDNITDRVNASARTKDSK